MRWRCSCSGTVGDRSAECSSWQPGRHGMRASSRGVARRLRPSMWHIDYALDRARDDGVALATVCADMTDFRIE